uniref:Obtusifoliol 14-alpha demethylase n=1 Tax=Oryza punctata TaxID=4537 RepID=A0A0E0LMC8_ORYPU
MELARGFLLLAFAPLIIAATILTKIVTRRTISTSTTSKRPPPPPMAYGAPVLGVLPALLIRGPLALIRDYYAEMGSVFTLRVLHRKVTFLVGPEESSHFFKGLESEISQDEISRFTIPTFGPGVAFDVDYATRKEQFRFFSDSMKPAKLRTYVSLMAREVEILYTVQEYFGRWEQSGVVDLKHELEHVVTLNACRCLFGQEVRAKMLGEVPALLGELNDSMRLVTIVLPYLPIPAHRRRDRARARLAEIFAEIVRSRRSSPGGGAGHDDMLQCLIDARYKDGRTTTEAEVAGMLVSALFAGQHTSSNTSTWTGACLLTHPEHLRAAVREQEELVRVRRHGDGDRDRVVVDYDALQRMGHLHCCVKETLRLHPPSLMLLRHARRSFVVRTRGGGAEYEVPAGHIVASPMVIHNALPHVYENAGAFDPGRFGPGREEDRAYGADHAYTAFGGGRHPCLGEAFAYMQIKVIWSHLLRNFELELVSPFPETDWNIIMPGPNGKVMVSYKRRKLY